MIHWRKRFKKRGIYDKIPVNKLEDGGGSSNINDPKRLKTDCPPQTNVREEVYEVNNNNGGSGEKVDHLVEPCNSGPIL